MSEHVVIVGGGFSGTRLARKLDRDSDVRVTLINDENYTTFSPMLPEVVGSTILPGQVIAPLRLMLGRHQEFVMGRVTSVNTKAQRVTYLSGGEGQELDYDHLVLALGARANTEMIPGMAEHAIPLKLIGDAMRIRNHVIARLEQAAHVSDPGKQRRLTHFAVVGGGFSGVEVAGEIHDFIHNAHRHYPRLKKEDLKVTVIHAGERLVPELKAGLAEKAARSMTRRGINLLFGALAKSIDEHGLTARFEDGREQRVEAATVISTIGTAPNPLLEKLGLPMETGRLSTNPDMSIDGADNVWALGDCAAVPNQASAGAAPPTAQFAVREADTLAENLKRSRRGEPTRAFSFGGLGTIATIGSKRGVAQVLGVPVIGFPAWLLWRAFYLLQMPTLSRKARIYVAWTWDMFFSNDIAQLRFTSSDEADWQQPEKAAANSPAPPDSMSGEECEGREAAER